MAERLTELPKEYRYFNDVDFKGFNIDHVVIGPGGIFLIETKSHGGRIFANDGRLFLNGSKPQKDFLTLQVWKPRRFISS